MSESTGRASRRTSSRGQHRRQLILGAATEILVQQGFAAVSHRTVAQRAQLPLSATTYYFDSLEDLLAQAVTQLAEAWLTHARAAVAGLPDAIVGDAQLADALIRVAAPSADVGSSAGLLTFYGRYVEAADHPGLRPLVVRYDTQLDALLSDVLCRGGVDGSIRTARLVLAVVDGATLRALAEGAEPADVASSVVRLVAMLRGAAATA